MKKRAFTLIELLVVIAIIGVLATISVIALSNARAKARDSKRAGNVKQIQTALEMFYNDKGRYPTEEEWPTGKIFSTTTNSTTTYMQIIPTAPTPIDGSCTDNQNTFSYTQTQGGNSYTISFCLGGRTGTLTSGPKCLTPGGIIDVDCSAGGGGDLGSNLVQLSLYESAGIESFKDVVSDDNYVYVFGENDSEGLGDASMLLKYNKADMSVVAKKYYATGIGSDHAIAESGDYLFVSYKSGISRAIAKIAKSDLSVVTTKVFKGSQAVFSDLSTDNNYVYAVGYQRIGFVFPTFGALVVKYNQSDLSIAAQRVYDHSSDHENFHSVVTDSNYVYAFGVNHSEGTGGASAFVAKYNKTDLSLEAGKYYDGLSIDWFSASAADSNYIYGLGYTNSEGASTAALVTKFNKSDLSISVSKIYDGDHYEDFYGAGVIGSNLYAIGTTYSEGLNGASMIVKYNTSDLSVASSKVIVGSWNYVYGGAVDNDNIYLAGETFVYDSGSGSAMVAKINSSLPTGTYASTPTGYTFQDINLNSSNSSLVLSNSTCLDIAISEADDNLSDSLSNSALDSYYYTISQ